MPQLLAPWMPELTDQQRTGPLYRGSRLSQRRKVLIFKPGDDRAAGALDGIVPPELSTEYASAARRAGDAVEVDVIEGAGHFELVNPASVAWSTVLAAVRALVDPADDTDPRH